MTKTSQNKIKLYKDYVLVLCIYAITQHFIHSRIVVAVQALCYVKCRIVHSLQRHFSFSFFFCVLKTFFFLFI